MGNFLNNMADEPEIISMVIHKDVRFLCKHGSITDIVADVAIVSSDPQFSMNNGAARALAMAGGRDFHIKRQEAIDAARERDQSYIVVDTQNIDELPYRSLVVLPIRARNRSSMRVIYRQAIKAAIDTGLKTVVMPLLGCGGFNIRVDRAAQELLEALLTFSTFGNITIMSFADISAHSMEHLGTLLETIPDMLPDLSSSFNGNSASPSIPALPASSNDDISIIAENIRYRPPNEVQYMGVMEPSLDPEGHSISIQARAQLYREISRDQVGGDNAGDNNTQEYSCSVCLNDLVTSGGNGEEDVYSLQNDPVVRLKLCIHEFHRSCIDSCFQMKKQCPLCMRWYAPSFGTQPINATMRIKRIPGNPPGHHNSHGWFKIKYVIPSGIQTASHIRPGVQYSGTTRTAFVPNDDGGRVVLRLLQKAFEHRHIFTIGDSITTGVHNVPVWVIHHKTSMTGGPPSYGYPDPEYYYRVTEELKAVGITTDLLDD